MQYIIVHYHEIALKGKNRIFFENLLVKNIRNLTKELGVRSVKRLYGRILLEFEDKEPKKDILDVLSCVFGISSFSLVLAVESDIEKIKKSALKLAGELHGTFKVETKRPYKEFSLKSPEISAEIGAFLFEKTKLKVDVKTPKNIIFLEVMKDKTFIYIEKNKGPGGLPVGSAGKVIVLISGGIDSPVAAYMAMKRGCELEFVHFHSYPFTDNASIEKVEELLKILKKYQPGFKLHLIPIVDFQKEVVKIADARYRILLYRRIMYKIAERISQKRGAKALVSGDSLGQVASQTLENMGVIGNGIDLPILRPLVGFDKEEIIELAKKIGTFDLSIEPHSDCCSVFMPKNPATKARLEDVFVEEAKLGMDNWVNKILNTINIITI